MPVIAYYWFVFFVCKGELVIRFHICAFFLMQTAKCTFSTFSNSHYSGSCHLAVYCIKTKLKECHLKKQEDLALKIHLG